MKKILEGEPVLKKSRKGCHLLGLTSPQWFDIIILPFISNKVEDLIALKRTCSIFAYFERLSQLIESKELALFGSSIPRHMWNKYSHVDGWGHTRFGEFCKTHIGKFWFFVQYQTMEGNKKSLGLYQDKHHLWTQAGPMINMITSQNKTEYVVLYICDIYGYRIGLRNGRFIINIVGCNEEVEELISI